MGTEHDSWVAALGVTGLAGPGSGPGSGGGWTPDMAAKCDAYLRTNRFHAEKREEIVPGDMQCDFFLNDHFIKLEEVCTALETQFPELKDYHIDVAHFVRDRWDEELKKALVLAGAIPADKPKPKTELKQEHQLTVLKPFPVPPKEDPPHLGVDNQIGIYPWSFQATLVIKDFDVKKFGNPKKLSLDLFHEPNLSLTLTPKTSTSPAALTAQEAIALLNLHWIPPWSREIEVPLSVFLNSAVTPNYGHVSGGVQLQAEQHIWDIFSITITATGTIDNGSFGVTGSVSALFHLKR